MKKLMYFVSFAVMTMMSVSCSNEEMDNVAPPTNERVPNYATMQFNGSKPSFDDDGITRGATDSWANGSKVYLQFMVGTNRVDGVATYNSSNQEWTVQYYGALTATNDGKCEAYYFENAGDATYRSVSLSNATAIYVDKSASYSFEDNTVKVTANLKPMTGRIRMKGTASQDFFLDGITCYNSYNIENNSFVSASPSIFATTGKDGYSDYVYGFFADNDNRDLIFNDIENNVSFIKTLGTSALAVGKSGYINIPTLENRSGWNTIRYKDYTIGKVDFRMIRVIGNKSQSSFYIGETEVTNGLWNAIMNTNLSDTNLPVSNISYDEIISFLTKLNAKTGCDFRLPTYAEWSFASTGGNLSRNYTYSGSNNYSEVAWCYENSGYAKHEVKILIPNEIGIYDMSGNVSETLLQESLSASAYYYEAGGRYDLNYSYCKAISYMSYSTSSDNKSGSRGFRVYSQN